MGKPKCWIPRPPKILCSNIVLTFGAYDPTNPTKTLVTVSNDGGQIADDVKLYLDIQSGTPTSTGAFVNNVWNIGTLAPGASVSTEILFPTNPYEFILTGSAYPAICTPIFGLVEYNL